MERSQGTLLGGRVRYAQPVAGYRTGLEPVLLAAAVPAQAGETVIEAGCGAGAALLCLLHRVAGLRGTGVELDPAMAELARDNVAANGAAAVIVTADVQAWRPEPAHHVMANPPWRDPAGTPPADERRRLALQGHGADWIGPLSAWVRPGGTLTLALPAGACAAAMERLRQVGLGAMLLLPLWPRAGVEARLVLLQGRRGPEGSRLLPGLVLHGAGAGFTAEAEAVLRGGAALPPGRAGAV